MNLTTSLQIYPTLRTIPDNFKGYLLDAYGVFWKSGLLPGSEQTMERLVKSGKIVGILSNSTQLAAKEIDKYGLHGLMPGRHFHFLITSGEVARDTFLNEMLPFPTPRQAFWVFCGAHPSCIKTIFINND